MWEWVVLWRPLVPTSPPSAPTLQVWDSSVTAPSVLRQDSSSSLGSVLGAKGDKTHASFDQFGIVYSIRTGRNSYLNLAFNYHKSKDFNYILAAANRLDGASQNKQTLQKWYNGAFYSNNDNLSTVDPFYLNDFLGRTDDEGKTYHDRWVDANRFRINREHEGYIADFDFSVSGNINDRVYLGVTFGIKDVNYKHYGLNTRKSSPTEHESA